MAYICSVLASQVQPQDLRLAKTECDGGKVEYQLVIEGSYLTIFTPDCSLESFAALGRRILYLCQKELTPPTSKPMPCSKRARNNAPAGKDSR